MKFGASSWPFQWEPPYEDCISGSPGVGFKAIELIGWNAGFLKTTTPRRRSSDLKGASTAKG